MPSMTSYSIRAPGRSELTQTNEAPRAKSLKPSSKAVFPSSAFDDGAPKAARTQFYLIGFPATHSIAAPIHNRTARSLNQNYNFTNVDCPSLSSAVSILHSPTFAGAVVTMPYKQSIIPHVDVLDDLAVKIGAINNIYFGKDMELRATNTDWVGIVGCLENAITSLSSPARDEMKDQTGLIIGAGGAARAAIYALSSHFHCRTIYIVNRDVEEVTALADSMSAYPSAERPVLVHVRTTAQAAEVAPPYWMVGTAPDFEPRSEEERLARTIIETFLSASPRRDADGNAKGVVLDMCYTPRQTWLLRSAGERGWKCVEGFGVVGWQLTEQWKLWGAKDVAVDMAEVHEMLQSGIEGRGNGASVPSSHL